MRIRSRIVLLLLVASVIIIVIVGAGAGMNRENRAVAGLRGSSTVAVVQVLGEPNLVVTRPAVVSDVLFAPPTSCNTNRAVASAYVYYRRWGRRSVIIYFDSAGRVVCSARRGLGISSSHLK